MVFCVTRCVTRASRISAPGITAEETEVVANGCDMLVCADWTTGANTSKSDGFALGNLRSIR
jgi:hypothetical protein